MILFGKEITKDSYPLYIAEISCNHGGSLEQAKELIHAAKEAGADAVKIQCYDADEMTFDNLSAQDVETITKPDYKIFNGPWAGRNLYELYRTTQTPQEWIEPLFNYANKIGIPIFSSVFGKRGLDWLEFVNCPAYKIASFENNDTELITKVAKTDKPLLISMGMASVQDINRIAGIVNPLNTVFMHCVSKYPTKPEEANLWKLSFLRGFYPIPVGFSDHTQNRLASMLAVSLGAKVIEKHLILNYTDETEDSEFSFNPNDFKEYIQYGKMCWDCVKNSGNDPEADSRQFRRSLYVVEDMEPGENFTEKNVRSIRPSYGLEPYRYKEILGKWAKVFIKAGTALKEEHLANG